MQQEQAFGNLGGVLDSDKIVICPSRENGKCYKYDPSGSWIHFATLRISRQHAGAVIVPGEFASFVSDNMMNAYQPILTILD